MLAPKSWRKGDIWVQMDKDMLEAVFDWVAHDCDACYHQSKRGYKRKAAGEESTAGVGTETFMALRGESECRAVGTTAELSRELISSRKR